MKRDSSHCNKEVMERGVNYCTTDITKEEAEQFCINKTKETGHFFDWHYVGGRVVIKVLENKIPVISESEAVGAWS